MKRSFLLNVVHLFFGIYTVLWLNAGNFRYLGDYIPAVVKFGMVFFWIALSFIKHPSFLIDYVKLSLPLIIFTFIMLVSFSRYTEQYQMNFIYCLIMLALFSYYFKYGTRKELKVLIIVFVIDILIVAVHTYVVLLDNPIVARAISTSATAREDLLADTIIPKGVGGYGLCYQLCCLIPMVSYFFNKKNLNIIIKFVVYAFILLLLFQAQFTLALIIYVVCIILSYSYGKKGTINLLVAKFVMVTVAVILIINLEPILESLIEISNEELAARLKEVLNLVRENDTSGSDMESRFKLYQMSLNSFGDNILIGSFGAKTYGSHSTFLDMLGAFGFIGALGYAGLLSPMFRAKKYISRNKEIKKVANLCILLLVILSIINVVTSVEIMITSLLILPLWLKYMYDGGGDTLENSPN